MFRRSGSAVTFFVEGKLPDARSPDLVRALREHRFRTIENAASEEVSIGWVSPADPTGESFELEDIDVDCGLWLRLRIDKKVLPPVWLRIHTSAAERGAGRRLTTAERRDLRADLHRKLLPRVLPIVQLVDVLVRPRDRTVMLFSTAKGTCEQFDKLFFKTFAVRLVPASPYALAARSGLGREALAYLDQVSPVRWPGGAEPVAAPAEGGAEAEGAT